MCLIVLASISSLVVYVVTIIGVLSCVSDLVGLLTFGLQIYYFD